MQPIEYIENDLFIKDDFLNKEKIEDQDEIIPNQTTPDLISNLTTPEIIPNQTNPDPFPN